MFRQFLKNGYAVFPIRPIIDGLCQCGCPKGGKHPYDKSWEKTPVWSQEKADQNAHRMGNYAVLVKRLLVIDVDPKNGGDKSFAKLVKEIPEILDCKFTVRTGGGGSHLYFSIDENLSLRTVLQEYPGIDFKSSGYVIGPGSDHLSGKKYEVITGDPSKISSPPAALLELLARPEYTRVDNVDISASEIVEMLEYVDPDCEEPTWRLIGGAIHYLTRGSRNGFELFDHWSSGGEKYSGWQSCMDKWRRYTPDNPAGVGTLRQLAYEGGYVEPVTFDPPEWDYQEEVNPISIPDSVDLQRPPGFVGEVADWINSRCPKPRERLAAAAALVAIGNIAGLRYEDDLPNPATSNLFVIGVSSSGSGKKSVKNCVSAIHREAGMGRVTFGKSKSSQEIYRALISHPICLFNIDELGIKFQAIANANKSGASYYETWFAEMMSIYSEANGTVDLQEDEYREIEKTLAQNIAFYRAKIDDNEDRSGKFAKLLEKAEKRLEGDLSLQNPFLSMIGFSTPETFNAMVTPARVTEGFIGRCLIVIEPLDVVKRKRDFQPGAMPEKLKKRIWALSSGGQAGEEFDPLENDGGKIRIKTTPQARAALTAITEEMEKLEEHYERINGMHAVPTRAEELIAKISFILAIPGGIRTEEHVTWAKAYVMRDIETKVALAVGNSKEEGALENKVLANLTRDEWVSTTQVRNRCRPAKVQDVLLQLYRLRDKGRVEGDDEAWKLV